MPIFKQIAEDAHSKRAFKEAKKLKPLTFESFKGPDGEYQGRLVSQNERKKDDNTMAFFNYVITEGKYKGEEVSNMYWLVNPKKGDNKITFSSLRTAVSLLGGDGNLEPEELDEEIGKIIRKKKSVRLKIQTSNDAKGTPRTRVWPAYSPTMLDVQKKMKGEEEVVEEKEVVEEEKKEYDGAALNGETVIFQDEPCLVLKHNTDAKTVQLGDPKDKDEIWYEDIEVSKLTLN